MKRVSFFLAVIMMLILTACNQPGSDEKHRDQPQEIQSGHTDAAEEAVPSGAVFTLYCTRNDADFQIVSFDLATSGNMVDICITLLSTDRVCGAVLEKAESALSVEQLRENLRIQASAEETEILEICVCLEDRQQALAIADAFCKVIPETFHDLVPGVKCAIVSTPVYRE